VIAGENTLDATVAICTFNGSERIGQVLESLASQRAGDATWEVVIVDNASTDDTPEVCCSFADQMPVPLRVACEERPGLSYARGCAARNARGQIVCFLDDDTPAEPDFVEAAIQAFRDHPNAGCLGGKVKPIWEQPPTPLVLEVCDFALAVCDYGDEPFQYSGVRAGGPVGAGICLRRDVLLQAYANDEWAAGNLGPVGKKRISGSEMALNAVIASLGHEMWYVPELVIHHIIPAKRMTFDYLAKLYESIGRGQAMTRRIFDWKARSAALAILLSARDYLRFIRSKLTGSWKGKLDSELDCQIRTLRERQLWGRLTQALPWQVS